MRSGTEDKLITVSKFCSGSGMSTLYEASELGSICQRMVNVHVQKESIST
jgi:hypothetical protein